MANSKTMIEYNNESALHKCTCAESATEKLNNNCEQPQKKTHGLFSNWKKITETILLMFVFVIVWCLFTIPTVLYALLVSQSDLHR